MSEPLRKPNMFLLDSLGMAVISRLIILSAQRGSTPIGIAETYGVRLVSPSGSICHIKSMAWSS